MTPVLTVFADLLGVMGGSVVMMSLGFPLITFFNQLQTAVSYGSLVGGLVKAFVFGILVAAIGCLRGLQTQIRRQRRGTIHHPCGGQRDYPDRHHRRDFFGDLLLPLGLNRIMATDDTIIRVDGFTAAYDGLVILDQLNFEVYRGEVFVILGGSGCGKSTLLKHMIGLYPPAAGTILIDGHNVTTAKADERQRLLAQVRRHVPKRRAVRLDDAAGQCLFAAARVYRSAAGRDSLDRLDEAAARRPRRLRRSSCRRN